MTRFFAGVVFLFLLLAGARGLQAQGGPPMITDDPGTPGNGRWETNLAFIFEHRAGETSITTPEIDLNYGVGENLQLTLQTAPVVLVRPGHGPITGPGGVEAAVKWRFLDEERDGLSVSTFPRLLFNALHSSVRRGLADDGTRFQLPVEMARKVGPIDLDLELGPLISSVGQSQWLYGIVGGFDLAKDTSIMAELQGTARSSLARDVLTANFGLRQKLTAACYLISSLGHEIRAPEREPLALVGYFGVQLLY